MTATEDGVALTTGGEVNWSGFGTGPVLLSERQLKDAAQALLEIPLDRVEALAAREIHSYVATSGVPPRSLLMHSATPTTKGFEGDLADVLAGRQAHDVATYIEARAVTLGRPGDLAVGRTAPWREAVQRAGIDAVDLGDRRHYYLSHALISAALRHQKNPVPALHRLIGWVRERPRCVVRLYALDRETQIFLLWLRRQAGLAELWVDANNPVVSASWNNKSHIHPSVADARAMSGLKRLGAVELTALEQRESAGYRQLGMDIPVLPGYLVPRGDDPEAFVADLLEASLLLRERYDLSWGCLKPCEAGDGARIVTQIDLVDEDALAQHGRDAFPHGDDYLLEAQVDLLTFEAGGRSWPLAPSGHIRNGHVADGLTAQLLNGCSWEGNAFVDARTCESIGISAGQYDQMIEAMHTIRESFHGPRSVRAGCHGGLVTGGIDFLIGRVGGRFGDQKVLGAVDFNLSSHGAEYLRAFHAEAAGAFVATRVYRPARAASLAATEAAAKGLARGPQQVRTIACVPGRWGMVATTGKDTLDALEGAVGLVEGLAACGLAEARPS